jgi:hypothetical protein
MAGEYCDVVGTFACFSQYRNIVLFRRMGISQLMKGTGTKARSFVTVKNEFVIVCGSHVKP